eukprot:TRINITY_DN5668_c0_g2_i2.p1 TRINITY_DN5668_c0_g2~~TRINITY_DN5668_c0_g2_i2.p1  ORF type:complete len:1033 (+),score=206.47 TRINITY_DN5668_c0_g2_i2:55-3153(+)
MTLPCDELQRCLQDLAMPTSVEDIIVFRRELNQLTTKINLLTDALEKSNTVGLAQITPRRPRGRQAKPCEKSQVLFPDSRYRWVKRMEMRSEERRSTVKRRLAKVPADGLLVSYLTKTVADRVQFIVPGLGSAWDIYCMGSAKTLPKLLSRTHRVLLSHIKWQLRTGYKPPKWHVLRAVIRAVGGRLRGRRSVSASTSSYVHENIEEEGLGSTVRSSIPSASESYITSSVRSPSQSLIESQTYSRTYSIQESHVPSDNASSHSAHTHTPALPGSIQDLIESGLRSDTALATILATAFSDCNAAFDPSYHATLARAAASLKVSEEQREQLEKVQIIEDLKHQLQELKEEYRDIAGVDAGSPSTTETYEDRESSLGNSKGSVSATQSEGTVLADPRQVEALQTPSQDQLEANVNSPLSATPHSEATRSTSHTKSSSIPTISSSAGTPASYSAGSEGSRPPPSPAHTPRPFVPPLNFPKRILGGKRDSGFLGPLTDYAIKDDSSHSADFPEEGSSPMSTDAATYKPPPVRKRQLKRKHHRMLRAGWKLAGLRHFDEGYSTEGEEERHERPLHEDVKWRVNIFSSDDDSVVRGRARIKYNTTPKASREAASGRETSEEEMGTLEKQRRWSMIAEAMGTGGDRYRDSVIASSAMDSVADSPLPPPHLGNLIERRNTDRPKPLAREVISPTPSLTGSSVSTTASALQQIITECYSKGLIGKEEFLKVKTALGCAQHPHLPKPSSSPMILGLDEYSVGSGRLDEEMLNTQGTSSEDGQVSQIWDAKSSSSANSMRMGSPRHLDVQNMDSSPPPIPDIEFIQHKDNSCTGVGEMSSCTASLCVAVCAAADFPVPHVGVDDMCTAAAIGIIVAATGDATFSMDLHEAEKIRELFLEEQRQILAELKKVYEASTGDEDAHGEVVPVGAASPFGRVDEKILLLFSDDNEDTEGSLTPLSNTANTDVLYDSGLSDGSENLVASNLRIQTDSDNSLLEWSKALRRRDQLWCVTMPSRAQLLHMTDSTTTSYDSDYSSDLTTDLAC